MKTLANFSAKKEITRIFKSGILLFLFITAFAMNAVADGGPSLENARKNAQAIKSEQEAISKARMEEMAFQERMSYLYMAVGLLLVIGIAWFSTVYARRSKNTVPHPTSPQQNFIKNSQVLHRRHLHPRDRARARRYS